MNVVVPAFLPFLSIGDRDYNLGQWDVGNRSTFFASCIRRPHSSVPPPPLSACVVINSPPSLIVARPYPTPHTASNHTMAVNRPSWAHHCYGIPPDCNHAHCHCFCCHSIDIGTPPLSRVCCSTLVVSSRAKPTPVSLKTFAPYSSNQLSPPLPF
jgi:hypothetical protein